jgi:HhH-GPD superfamily base excision DNA repair protein
MTLQRQKIAAIVSRLLEWFPKNARDLPWRRTTDPYGIWVSEIMLQQTQVKAVLPYWERWMRALPTLEALANERAERLHKLWEGLGYYRRVRNMHRAARRKVPAGFRSNPGLAGNWALHGGCDLKHRFRPTPACARRQCHPRLVPLLWHQEQSAPGRDEQGALADRWRVGVGSGAVRGWRCAALFSTEPGAHGIGRADLSAAAASLRGLSFATNLRRSPARPR